MGRSRFHIKALHAVLALACTTSTAPAESWVVLKGGSYSLDHTNQSITADVGMSGLSFVTDIEATFDKQSSIALALGYEWRYRNGFAIGPELLYFRHEWSGYETMNPSNRVSGDIKTLAILFAPKQYIKLTPWFQPYVGVGIGIAFPSIGGGADGTTAALIGHGSVGVDFQFGNTGVVLEYKVVEDLMFDSENGDVNIGGKAIFGGMCIRF